MEILLASNIILAVIIVYLVVKNIMQGRILDKLNKRGIEDLSDKMDLMLALAKTQVALSKIIEMETPNAAPAAKRMAKVAREALDV